MARLLGVDVGTSAVKAVLVDDQGVTLAEASEPLTLQTPHPLWAEQDPEEWWAGVQACLGRLGTDVDAIGLTGQMHGAVVLDAEDRVLRPAPIWCDQRTREECREIEATLGADRVRQVTGNPMLTGFQAPKLLWMRNNELSRFGQATRALLPKDFVRYRLTGEAATDPSDASGVGLFDVRAREWWVEGILGLELVPSLFPVVRESWEVTGETQDGVPVVAGAGDQAAGAVEVGAVGPGVVSVSLGTSGVVFAGLDAMPEGVPDSLQAFAHADGRWHVMGVVLSCGGAVRWARDVWFPEASFDEMAALAAGAPPGADGLTFVPALAGERCPVVAPGARAALLGLTLSHDRRHVARAVFEGVTFSLAKALELVSGVAGRPSALRLTGGGAQGRFWAQSLADATGVPCEVSGAGVGGPAVGAALLAGVGVGVWPDVRSAAGRAWRPGERFEPGAADLSEAFARFRSSSADVWAGGRIGDTLQ